MSYFKLIIFDVDNHFLRGDGRVSGLGVKVCVCVCVCVYIHT